LNAPDWIVLIGTLSFIAIYGAWKTRGVKDMRGYFLGDNSLRWPTIGLSIMATQASAITFLSTPGQAYDDGMRFVQFYFGLPLAMIVISQVFVPIYHKLKVYTAYEYLEHRFDSRVRYLGAVLFLVQRGLAAGITIYAPAIIFSRLFGWSLNITTAVLGFVVIAYTLSGGVRAVSETQKQQMVIMLGGIGAAIVLMILRLPDTVSLSAAVKVAGALDRMNPVTFDFDLEDRYNFWSGISGGFFLALAYFGTDQSQVQRYLAGKSIAEKRLGLLFNGMFKIPMQFAILFSGVMVFVFYIFTKPPIFFNAPVIHKVAQTAYAGDLRDLQQRYDHAFETQKRAAEKYVGALESANGSREEKLELRAAAAQTKIIREEAKALIKTALPGTETRDTDYIFLSFVLNFVPTGLIGLLIAVILCAAMCSTASELAALGSTTTIDLYKRAFKKESTPQHDLRASRAFTVLWGCVAIGFATFAGLVDNLIQAVNIIGSIFYGTVLGIFLVAFLIKSVTGTPVLIAALIAQATVIGLYFASAIGFLWYNVIGCGIVVCVASLLQLFTDETHPKAARSS
jgi:Na+/proline symporter